MMKLVDPYGRTIDYLRISITDRCNLDCLYCAPLGGRKRRSHAEILSYEEILRITNAAVHSGISKIRITGGEPLQRKGMVRLCRMLADIDGIESLAMTSNGILLKEFAAPLFEAGVRRVNISLDTLKPERFRNITGKDLLSQVFEGIEAAEKVGLTFEPENVDELCEKLLMLKNDPDLYLRLMTRCIEAAKHYDRKALATKMLNILEQYESAEGFPATSGKKIPSK